MDYLYCTILFCSVLCCRPYCSVPGTVVFAVLVCCTRYCTSTLSTVVLCAVLRVPGTPRSTSTRYQVLGVPGTRVPGTRYSEYSSTRYCTWYCVPGKVDVVNLCPAHNYLRKNLLSSAHCEQTQKWVLCIRLVNLKHAQPVLCYHTQTQNSTGILLLYDGCQTGRACFRFTSHTFVSGIHTHTHPDTYIHTNNSRADGCLGTLKESD